MQNRVFTESESASRDAFIIAAVDYGCVGCVEDHRGWCPAQECPVHGEHPDAFWRELNTDLDARWPGKWVECVLPRG